MSASSHPNQWVCRKDPRTQRTYYVNRRTGRSTWEPVHDAAVPTEPVTALFPAAAPITSLPDTSTQVTGSIGTSTSPVTGHTVSVPSSASPPSGVRHHDGSGAMGESSDLRETPQSTRKTPADEGAVRFRPAASTTSSPNGSSNSSSSGGSAISTNHQVAPSPPSREQLEKGPPSSLVASPLPIRVPFSHFGGFSDASDTNAATPLGTLAVQHGRSPTSDAAHGADFLAASAEPTASLPPADTLTRSPADRTASLSSPSTHSPLLQRRGTVGAESSTSLSSNQTQRPSNATSTFALESSSRPSQMPPPLPLPSLVTPPATSSSPSGGGKNGGARSSVDTTAAAMHDHTVVSSSSPPVLPYSQQQPSPSQGLDADFDQEAAAAEEWQLTRRTWELEGERARLESELAVLRGPVEVETQSIAEEHDRLLDAQRALETAATLAVTQQKAKQAELERLQRRLAELQEQRRNTVFFTSTLRERLAVVKERCHTAQAEAEQLRQQRRELEDVHAPSEEAALRSAQSRLYDQRQRVVTQRLQLEERTDALTRVRAEMQRQKAHLDELTALPLGEDASPDRTHHGSSSSPITQRESSSTKDNTDSRSRSASGALVVTAGSPGTALSQHGRQLQTRIAELQREVACLQTANHAFYENKLLVAQQQVLKEWTQRLRGETEAWQPTLGEARAMLRELRQFSKMQAWKYGVKGSATS